MPDVLTRPRCDLDIPALIDILARQQAETQYPFRWPPDQAPEHFLHRPSEREAWVAELAGHVVGHVAIQTVADDELGQMWAAAHGVPITELRCISVLYADRRLPRRCSPAPRSGHSLTVEHQCWTLWPDTSSR